MAIDKATLKEMVGKRITIDGNRHRVEKVVQKTGEIITRDGTKANADGVYKKGPGFFYDTPAKGKRKTASAAAEPKETAREKRAREKREAAEAAEPKESARAKRARLKKEAEEAEAPEKPTRQRRRTTDAKPGAKGSGKSAPFVKKKIVEQFDQALSEQVCNEFFGLSSEFCADRSKYALTAVAVGANYNEDAVQVTVTLMSASKSAKEIKAYIRDNRLATDISPDDEEDDDLVDAEDDDIDDTLEDDEEDDGEEDLLGELNELSRVDLRKIAKNMEIDDYKSFSKEDLAQELSEYEEDDVREAAASAGVDLGEEEGDDDLEEEEDPSDDEEDDESDDEEEDDESDDDEEEEDESATVEDLVREVLEVAPLKEASVTKFVEAFLANDEIAEKFDGELVPGRTKLQEKGGKGPEMLLVGFDEANSAIKLLNLSTLKTRSKTISEVVHMEVLEADAE